MEHAQPPTPPAGKREPKAHALRERGRGRIAFRIWQARPGFIDPSEAQDSDDIREVIATHSRTTYGQPEFWLVPAKGRGVGRWQRFNIEWDVEPVIADPKSK